MLTSQRGNFQRPVRFTSLAHYVARDATLKGRLFPLGSWETNYYELSIDDYVEGWSPQDVCDKLSGTHTSCSAPCCIYSEDRNNVLSIGECPGESI